MMFSPSFAVIQGQLEAHADDSVPAREHRGRELPSWSCEFDSRHSLSASPLVRAR
jgi:hypothetical protein